MTILTLSNSVQQLVSYWSELQNIGETWKHASRLLKCETENRYCNIQVKKGLLCHKNINKAIKI